MPYVDPNIFGKKPRFDKKPGYQEIVPTVQKYVEEDKTDVRVYRLYTYDGSGRLEKTQLMDTMGVRFADEPALKDDRGYIEELRNKQRK